MENKQSWVERNPDKVKAIKDSYYLKNQEQAKLRSKRQNLRGKVAYSMLSDKDKRKCDTEVENRLTSDI